MHLSLRYLQTLLLVLLITLFFDCGIFFPTPALGDLKPLQKKEEKKSDKKKGFGGLHRVGEKKSKAKSSADEDVEGEDEEEEEEYQICPFCSAQLNPSKEYIYCPKCLKYLKAKDEQKGAAKGGGEEAAEEAAEEDEE